ncbi:hypothetical protein J6590_070416 [Homalodisca vitripennis]|nr:hypothetical protein J6590_070416 [Homalodisca vitripennis]
MSSHRNEHYTAPTTSTTQHLPQALLEVQDSVREVEVFHLQSTRRILDEPGSRGTVSASGNRAINKDRDRGVGSTIGLFSRCGPRPPFLNILLPSISMPPPSTLFPSHPLPLSTLLHKIQSTYRHNITTLRFLSFFSKSAPHCRFENL